MLALGPGHSRLLPATKLVTVTAVVDSEAESNFHVAVVTRLAMS